MGPHRLDGDTQVLGDLLCGGTHSQFIEHFLFAWSFPQPFVAWLSRGGWTGCHGRLINFSLRTQPRVLASNEYRERSEDVLSDDEELV